MFQHLLGHLNDCEHEFSVERSSEACVKQLEILGFDINAFVNNISRNTIVVLINKGKYEDGRLYLSKNIDTDSMKFFINLKDINHIVL